jgi:hypothetical protein
MLNSAPPYRARPSVLIPPPVCFVAIYAALPKKSPAPPLPFSCNSCDSWAPPFRVFRVFRGLTHAALMKKDECRMLNSGRSPFLPLQRSVAYSKRVPLPPSLLPPSPFRVLRVIRGPFRVFRGPLTLFVFRGLPPTQGLSPPPGDDSLNTPAFVHVDSVSLTSSAPRTA